MDVYGVRNANARALAKRFDTITEFSSHVGIIRNRVSSLLSRSESSKNIGAKTARQIEKACGKPLGWLDINHSTLSPSEVSSEEIAIKCSILFSEISDITEMFGSGKMSGGQTMKLLILLIEAIQSVKSTVK